MPLEKKIIPFIPKNTPLNLAEQVRRTNSPKDYTRGMLFEEEFLGIIAPDSEFIFKDLFRKESIMIVNGSRGSGKSWFVMSLANEATWGGRVGAWECENPVNVLLVDGEMPIKMLQERLVLLNGERDPWHKKTCLHIYPENYAYRIGLKRANILDPLWREVMLNTVLNEDIELLVLDNLSSLAPGIDENDKLAFDPVNRWLLEMRFMGVAIIMAHHTGKAGNQRGTSAHEDHVDTALLIKNDTSVNGCGFRVEVSKDRAFLIKDQETRLVLKKKGKGAQLEVIRKKEGEGMGVLRANPDMTWGEAKKKGINSRTFYRYKKKLGGEGRCEESE